MTQIKHSLELEQRVLEVLMHFGDYNNIRVQGAMLKLTTDCFYTHNHAILFAMIRDSFNRQEPFSFVDILVQIPKDSTDLHDVWAWISDNYGKFQASESNLEHDVDALILLAKLRKQIDVAKNMIHDVALAINPKDAQEIVNAKISEIANLQYRQSKLGISNIELSEEYYEGHLETDLLIPTTCDQLNSNLGGGIMSKSLIIVAAGASVGKTGFSIFLLDCIARAQPDTQSLFFSIEMEAKHIWSRHVGIRAGKKFDALNEQDRLNAISSVMQVPVQIYDTRLCRSVSDIDFIVQTSRLKAIEKPISVIVVDYLGLVSSKGNFERNDLRQSDITTKLAQLAIELDCTVIALSQINRGSANRATDDRCPWPHDAADSSGGHRSAALWLGVDRPELYQPDPIYRNQFIVKCRKNRFGNIFEMTLAFNDGTFGIVPPGWFKTPIKQSKQAEKSIFKGYSDDFYSNS